MAQDAPPTFVAGVMLLAFVVSGCVGGGARPSFSVESIPAFSASGHAVAEERWWKEFRDAGLNREVNLALTGNFDLAVALQRLRAARAVTRREASDFFPDLDGFVDVDHTFQPGRNQTRTTWGLDASYQVDLWGRIQARVDAEQFRADATEADYHAVALTLAAEVSRTWFSLIESYAQLDLLDEQLESNRQGQKNVELRFATGGSGGSPDVLRQRQLVQSTLEQVIVVKANIEVLEHRLAVLTGQPPQTATYSPGSDFPVLPPLPATGLPSDLLNRRPDVRRDYLAFIAAERDLEAAVTDQYPRLNLRASLVNAAEHPESLFRDWFLSIGGQLIGPILDGGQRRAEIERARAVMHQRFAEYRQTTQIALQEIEDGLALERYQIQRIEKLQDQLELARLASEGLRERIITEDASFLDVLSAIQSQQRLQRTILSARLDLILIRIGLYLALAGDFDTRPDVMIELPAPRPESPPLVPPEPAEPAGPVEPVEEANPDE